MSERWGGVKGEWRWERVGDCEEGSVQCSVIARSQLAVLSFVKCISSTPSNVLQRSSLSRSWEVWKSCEAALSG